MLFANKWLEDEPACPVLTNSWNNTYRTSLLYGSDASWVVGLLLPQSLGNSRGLTNEPPLTPQSSSSFTELVSTKTKASLHNAPEKQISHFSQLTMLELDMGIWFRVRKTFLKSLEQSYLKTATCIEIKQTSFAQALHFLFE